MNGSVDWTKQWEDTINTWFDWSRRIMNNNECPLSGNVDQVIHAVGEKIGQLGLFNISLPGSRNPLLEWSIVSRWSYGRQLGRVIELLGAMVDVHRDELKKKNKQALEDFDELRAQIKRIREEKEDR